MKDLSKIGNSLQAKVTKLIELHKALEAENIVLKNDKKELAQKVEDQKNIINELEERYKVSKIVKALNNNESANDAKLKINELVREIEKCIVLLNR